MSKPALPPPLALSAHDSSVLSAIAGRPHRTAFVETMASRLESDHAREIARALQGMPASDVARETADAMLRWYEAKREQQRAKVAEWGASRRSRGRWRIS